MVQAKDGDTVRVQYTGKLADGSVFDSSAKSDALQFTIGEGQVLQGFERAVIGNESKGIENGSHSGRSQPTAPIGMR